MAALALGVVMTYRSSGVVNFAHAATGTYLAFAFFEFRETGDLVLPLFAIAHRIPLFPRPTLTTALLVFIIYGALLGLVIHTLVFRPLRHAPGLARVVASVGLFLYFWAVIGLEWTLTPVVRPVLPRSGVLIFGKLVGQDRLILGAMVVVLAAILWAVSKHTRFGLVTTAAAENEKGALLAGLNPERIAAINWMVATSLAGLAMIFSAQIVALDALNNGLLIVPALAAALIAGFKSYPITAAAAIGIGMAQSWLLNLQSDVDWLPDVGLHQGLPFLIILVVMALRGESLPTRGTLREGRYPEAPEPKRPALTTTVLVLAAVAISLFVPDWRFALITSAIFALMALSVVVVTGFVGQISFAPYAFAGFAAFAMVRFDSAGLPFPLSPLAAVAATGVLGVLVGLPAVKVRGLNLAIVTLGAAVAIQELLFKWDWFVGSGVGTRIPEPVLGALDLSISEPGSSAPRLEFALLCVGVLALCGLIVANLRRGSTGLTWLAVRANEQAAAAAGVNVRGAKLSSFCISAMLAGVGGCLLAYQLRTLSAESFGVFASLSLVALTYLAGIAAMSGSLTAGLLAPIGLLATAMGQGIGNPSPYQFAISGLLLVAMAVLYPNGITGFIRAGYRAVISRGRTDAESEPSEDSLSRV